MAGRTRARVTAVNKNYRSATMSEQQSAEEIAHQPSSASTTVPDDTIHSAYTKASSQVTPQRPQHNSLGSHQNQGSNGQSQNGTIRNEHSEATNGVSENGIEMLGRGTKELVLAINTLERLGLSQGSLAKGNRSKSEIPSPKVVVVGDQSAGKSSVIEAISDIKVPRSSGTCTRCPLNITSVANDEPGAVWQCRVYLHKKFDYHGSYPLPSLTKEKEKIPFHPWVERDAPMDIPFTVVNHKDSLAEIIRRAQLATLNPTHDPDQYIDEHAPFNRNMQVEFSPNLVCLDISGPGLPNLSFYDLPGVINQTEDDGKPYLVKLVKNLVKEYIKSENALVLLATSMEGDAANSSAAKIVRKLKAESRCIGVLTKPDRLPQGDPIDVWKAMLSGKKFQLGYGYFVTKQPAQSDLDRGIDHVDARRMEMEFFESNEPWATEFAEFRPRFGTRNLQDFLSQKLTAQILATLPLIRDRVKLQLDQIDAEIKYLPEPPTHNALGIVLELLQYFTDHVQKAMEGQYPYNEWRLVWKGLRQTFYQKLEDLKPTLRVSGKLDRLFLATTNASPSKDTDPITIDSDEEFGTPCPVPASTPSKKRKMEGPETPSQTPVPPTAIKSQNFNKGPAVRKNQLAKTFMLDEIKKTLDDISTSDIPGEVDPKALDYLIVICLKHWNQPTTEFFTTMEIALRSQLRSIFDEAFEAWASTEIYSEAWAIVEQFLIIHLGEQKDTLAPHMLSVEQEKPFTDDHELWDYHIVNAKQGFQEARLNHLFQKHFQSMASRKPLSQAERERMLKDPVLREKFKNDPYHREVEVMAKIRGYYKIASTRFYDNICLSLQAKLFRKLRTALHEELTSGLKVYEGDGRERCIQLLAEDGERRQQRFALMNRRKALLEGQKCLDELDRKYQEGPVNSSDVSNGSSPLPLQSYAAEHPTSSDPMELEEV
ncbi:hypothetical protein K432DRAFT_393431 [Lepidopterella palustris CBS 459.81]|uniref:P-loop containing nucleoside triphosphate hydrolase protein n=1 Tax=Lepidopterella palustris CBS 459.81 TaxID=1314670 RepID=A0A8E2E9K3_9PEZI|nr:hypothetical protein K432DRAFT_393431 [Lepidopterella palustris CBS 459.81]